MTTIATSRETFKAACLAILDEMTLEHPAGHQGKLAARYILRAANGERTGLMFEKSEKTKPYLWVDRRFARKLMDANIEFRISLASSLYLADESDGKTRYGRHAALKSMRDLANADLVRFTIGQPDQIRFILERLEAEA
jgi:hypothetical protein